MARTTPATNNGENETVFVPEVMTDKEIAKASGQTVEIARSDFNDLDLRNINSFEDAAALLGDIEIVSVSEVLGNGFSIINDKGNLCGIPLFLLGWNFNTSTKGEGEFVSVYVLAKMPGIKGAAKLIVNDGSVGLCKQLRDYTNATGRTKGMKAERGLTRSDYEKEINGEMKQVTTFYLDTSAA